MQRVLPSKPASQVVAILIRFFLLRFTTQSPRLGKGSSCALPYANQGTSCSQKPTERRLFDLGEMGMEAAISPQMLGTGCKRCMQGWRSLWLKNTESRVPFLPCLSSARGLPPSVSLLSPDGWGSSPKQGCVSTQRDAVFRRRFLCPDSCALSLPTLPRFHSCFKGHWCRTCGWRLEGCWTQSLMAGRMRREASSLFIPTIHFPPGTSHPIILCGAQI